jgi:hypothetical protein
LDNGKGAAAGRQIPIALAPLATGAGIAATIGTLRIGRALAMKLLEENTGRSSAGGSRRDGMVGRPG